MIVWIAIAAVVGIICLVLWKHGKMKVSTAAILPLLALYFSFVLTMIFERVPTRKARYELALFWSYQAIVSGTTKLISENFWNAVLFVPIGMMLSRLAHRKYLCLSAVLRLILSAGMEENIDVPDTWNCVP